MIIHEKSVWQWDDNCKQYKKVYDSFYEYTGLCISCVWCITAAKKYWATATELFQPANESSKYSIR